jgi:hypothetical protein
LQDLSDLAGAKAYQAVPGSQSERAGEADTRVSISGASSWCSAIKCLGA